MNIGHWILKDGKPVKATLYEWAKWFEHGGNRIVKQEMVGGSRVSTVFLGIDHSFYDDGPPILWETMVFGGKLDQEQRRCAGNWEQAEAMHEEMKAEVILCQEQKKTLLR